jgi:hypothetical protein
MTRTRLLLLPLVLALSSSGLLLVHCISGTTPDCSSADAGCGPGVEAGPDTGFDAGLEASAQDAGNDTSVDSGHDAGHDAGQDSGHDAGAGDTGVADAPSHG